MPCLLSHNYNKYDHDKPHFFLSDRQFPRKGGSTEVCLSIALYPALSSDSHMSRPVLRLGNNGPNGGDCSSYIKCPEVQGSPIVASSLPELVHRKGGLGTVSPHLNYLLPKVIHQRPSHEEVEKVHIVEGGHRPALHLVLRLRGGAPNHDGDRVFERSPGVGNISTANFL
jgi:hypothetical protein